MDALCIQGALQLTISNLSNIFFSGYELNLSSDLFMEVFLWYLANSPSCACLQCLNWKVFNIWETSCCLFYIMFHPGFLMTTVPMESNFNTSINIIYDSTAEVTFIFKGYNSKTMKLPQNVPFINILSIVPKKKKKKLKNLNYHLEIYCAKSKD